MAKLRKEVKATASHGYKSFQCLANSLAPVVNLDSFLPRCAPLPHNPERDMDALVHKPVLVLCCDEERKQWPIWINLTFSCNTSEYISIITSFDFYFCWMRILWMNIKPWWWYLQNAQPTLRVKWVNQALWALKLRGYRKPDFHHRSSNDAKLAIQHTGFWGSCAKT